MKKKIHQFLSVVTSKLGQVLVGLFVLITVLVFTTFWVWEKAAQPYAMARNQAESVAREYANVDSIDSFAIYNGTETFYSLEGTDKEGVDLLILVPEKSGSILTYQKSAGVSEVEAQEIATNNGATSIDRVVLGFEEGKPIWEVKSGTAYYIVDFETGDFVKKEGL
ncbi:cell wall elongation regulator TseB-like domain-containing protein [Streptococcus suis]